VVIVQVGPVDTLTVSQLVSAASADTPGPRHVVVTLAARGVLTAGDDGWVIERGAADEAWRQLGAPAQRDARERHRLWASGLRGPRAARSLDDVVAVAEAALDVGDIQTAVDAARAIRSADTQQPLHQLVASRRARLEGALERSDALVAELLAQPVDDDRVELRARALRAQAWRHNHRGELDEAIARLEARRLDHDDPMLHLRLHSDEAVFTSERGDLRRATQLLHAAHGWLALVPTPDEARADLHMSRGCLAVAEERLDVADAAFDDAAEAYELLRDHSGRAWALASRGEVQLACGEVATARQTFRISAEWFAAAGDVNRGVADLGLACCAAALGQPDAEAALDAAIRWARATERPTREAIAWCWRGLTADDAAQATADLRRAASLLDERPWADTLLALQLHRAALDAARPPTVRRIADRLARQLWRQLRRAERVVELLATIDRA